ncbi:MAG: FAD-dependent oxidoreductase, partial [Pseudomonadota bacterium]
MTTERESMEFDVVIVGGGPAGLAAACQLQKRANESGQELSVVVVEKGAEFGAHILSGNVFEPRALEELFPDWKAMGAPLETPVTRDEILYMTGETKARKVPGLFIPRPMHNEGNYIISLGSCVAGKQHHAHFLGLLG